MVTCKNHPSEPDVGVCASCLRDRLLGLDSCLTPAPYPPPSSSQKSSQPLQDHSNRPLFFAAGPPPPPLAGKKPGGGFSVLSTLFGSSTSGNPSPSSGERQRRASSDDHHPSFAPQRYDPPAAAPPSFSSWLAALFAVRCKRNNQKRRPGGGAVGLDSQYCGGAAEDNAARQRTACRLNRCRGMSPRSEPEEEDEDQLPRGGQDGRAAAASPSGSSTGSSEGHPALPGPTPARNNLWRRDGTAVKTGFAVCFSPLVRPRPHHHRRCRVVAGDGGGGGAHYGEVQKPGIRHGRLQQQQHQRLRQGGGVKLCTNRSRKLVDMGRFR